MDDLAKICVEVGVGQANKVVQSVLRNISLPLKFAYLVKSILEWSKQSKITRYWHWITYLLGIFLINLIRFIIFTFAFFTDGSEVGVGVHVSAEGSIKFQVFSWYGSWNRIEMKLLNEIEQCYQYTLIFLKMDALFRR